MPIPNLPDEAHRITDRYLSDLEKRLKTEYEQAALEVKVKLDDYLRRFQTKDKIKRKQLAAGEITRKEYNDWRTGQIMMGKRWEEMRDTLAQDLCSIDNIARSIIDGYMPEVYALNHNYATFTVERDSLVDTSYTLYNREAVERLIRQNPDLLPSPGKRVKAEIAEGRALRWNRQRVQSTMMQGILQGEGIPDLARRVSRDLGVRSLSDAVRYARTATTGAENAGRENSYNRAERMGINLTREWIATLDNRTRHSHRHMHGQVKNGEYYSNRCRYPGDPNGPAAEIWNCRCSEVALVKGLERDAPKKSPKIGNMTFEEWLEAKPKHNPITRPIERSETIRQAHIANNYERVNRSGK